MQIDNRDVPDKSLQIDAQISVSNSKFYSQIIVIEQATAA